MNFRKLTCQDLKSIRTDRRYTVAERNAAERELTRRDDQRRIKTAKAKAKIRQNIYGNTNGYISGRKVIEFGTDDIEAEAWLATALAGKLDQWTNSSFRNQAWLDVSEARYAAHKARQADKL